MAKVKVFMANSAGYDQFLADMQASDHPAFSLHPEAPAVSVPERSVVRLGLVTKDGRVVLHVGRLLLDLPASVAEKMVTELMQAFEVEVV